MICPYCRNEVNDGVKFCPSCGGDLTNVPQTEQPVQQPVQQPAAQPQMAQAAPVAAQPKNGKAVAAFVCGIIGALCCTYLGIPAIVCGILGILDAKNGKADKKNVWMAYAGLILGIIAIILMIVNIATMASGTNSTYNDIMDAINNG